MQWKRGFFFCRNKENYRAKHAEYKKHCDKAKKISWADYKEKINSVEAKTSDIKLLQTYLYIFSTFELPKQI